jgi:hypothetical protein
LLPEDQQLLSDQQLRDASDEQLQDLIARLDLLLRSKGQPGLTTRLPPEDERDIPEPTDPSDPLEDQVPSALSSSLCPEKTQRRPAKPMVGANILR